MMLQYEGAAASNSSYAIKLLLASGSTSTAEIKEHRGPFKNLGFE